MRKEAIAYPPYGTPYEGAGGVTTNHWGIQSDIFDTLVQRIMIYDMDTPVIYLSREMGKPWIGLPRTLTHHRKEIFSNRDDFPRSRIDFRSQYELPFLIELSDVRVAKPCGLNKERTGTRVRKVPVYCLAVIRGFTRHRICRFENWGLNSIDYEIELSDKEIQHWHDIRAEAKLGWGFNSNLRCLRNRNLDGLNLREKSPFRIYGKYFRDCGIGFGCGYHVWCRRRDRLCCLAHIRYR